jgi:RNA polymerase sigma-70 factor (ECF subfamily)
MGAMQEPALRRVVTSPVERLYREQGDRMWRSVLAFSGDPDVASDAVAEAFAQALRRGDALRDPGPWTWRAAFRIARGELKARRRRPVPIRAPHVEMPEPAVELVRALRQLPARQRAAVVLHHAADLPVREVAAALGTSAAAARMSLTRGRRRLRELLKEDR